MMKTDRLEWRSRMATEFLIGNLKGLLVLYCAFLLKKQYSGLKDCRVLEYDTEQQVSG